MYMIDCENVRDLRSSPIHLVMNDIVMFNICLSAHADQGHGSHLTAEKRTTGTWRVLCIFLLS